MSYGETLMLERKKAGIYHKNLSKAINIKLHTLIDIEKERIEISTNEFDRIRQKIKDLSKDEN